MLSGCIGSGSEETTVPTTTPIATTLAPTTAAPTPTAAPQKTAAPTTTAAPKTTVPPKTTIAPTTRPPTTTAAPTTVAPAADVRIVRIFYDGAVARVESDEYVEIKNYGSCAQNLKGWRLKDIADGKPTFTFPSYILEPGQTIRVYTNEVHNEWGGFSFRSGTAIWNNSDPDVAGLYNSSGVLVSQKSY